MNVTVLIRRELQKKFPHGVFNTVFVCPNPKKKGEVIIGWNGQKRVCLAESELADERRMMAAILKGAGSYP